MHKAITRHNSLTRNSAHSSVPGSALLTLQTTSFLRTSPNRVALSGAPYTQSVGDYLSLKKIVACKPTFLRKKLLLVHLSCVVINCFCLIDWITKNITEPQTANEWRFEICNNFRADAQLKPLVCYSLLNYRHLFFIVVVVWNVMWICYVWLQNVKCSR